MTKDEILENMDDWNAEQLLQFIQQGIVTLEELRKTRKLDHSKRIAITERIKQEEISTEIEKKKDEDAWEHAKYGTEEDIRNYISKFPKGDYVMEAKKKIDEFEEEKRRNRDKRNSILRDLRGNLNNYDLSDFRQIIAQYKITVNELDNIGIPSEIINSFSKINAYSLDLGIFPKAIPEGFTEVYFWGSPGSGKTCALGSIIGTAHDNGTLNLEEGEGFNYMTSLKNIFTQTPVVLPPPTPFHDIQYLPITIQKNNKAKPRTISLMEISGEIFECFYYKVGKLDFPSKNHQDVFDNFLEIVGNHQSLNRKVHFFFIDYEKGSKLDSKNKTQDDYLSATAKYLDKLKVFDKSTDVIYLIVTKADLMSVPTNERKDEAKKYLTKNFPSFVNNMKTVCKKYSINSENLLFDTFSIGDIFFKDLAILDPCSAENILEILHDRIRPNRNNPLLKILKK